MLHELRKQQVKPAVDSNPPNQPFFMKNNSKRKVMRQLYNQKVFYENELLLKKLNHIERNEGALNAHKIRRNHFAYGPAMKCFQQGGRNTLSNGWLASQKSEQVFKENEVCLVSKKDDLIPTTVQQEPLLPTQDSRQAKSGRKSACNYNKPLSSSE